MKEQETTTLVLTSLPVFPAVAQTIIDSFNDPFVTAQKIVGVVEHDPAIAARLVGLANSAYFSQQQVVGSLETAVIRVLGLDLTRGVALGMALNNISTNILCSAFDSHRFWRDSLSVALITQALARRTDKLNDNQQSLPYLAGLLSRIGLLALLMNAEEKMPALLHANDDGLAERLQQEALPDHLEAAGWLSNEWGLPSALTTALTLRHSPQHCTGDALANLLQCAVISSELINNKDNDSKKEHLLLSLLPNESCITYITEQLQSPELLQDAVSQSLAAVTQ